MRKEQKSNLGISDLLDIIHDILNKELGSTIFLLFLLLVDIICRVVKKREKHTDEESE